MMNNKVVNKQISLETIVKVANHLEDYKENMNNKYILVFGQWFVAILLENVFS